MARTTNRPLSPHLTIWRWGPAMLVSILHRATGTALAVGGGVLFAWWLTAAASGAESYATFYRMVVGGPEAAGADRLVAILARLVGIGLTWAFFQHMASGLRHFVLDTGAGYELASNATWSKLTIVFSITATALFWALVWAKY